MFIFNRPSLLKLGETVQRTHWVLYAFILVQGGIFFFFLVPVVWCDTGVVVGVAVQNCPKTSSCEFATLLWNGRELWEQCETSDAEAHDGKRGALDYCRPLLHCRENGKE